MALVRWLLEDLIITDTSKENVFELQENYPCCSRDMVITAGAGSIINCCERSVQ